MTDVFISYAREDRPFVQRLHDALASEGRQSWVDWEGIPASAKWMAEVRAAIDEADCFCFVVSPDSVESPVCREEAAHAAASNKRILPLLHRPVQDGLVPETVAAHNWIEFDGTGGFDEAFATLVRALETEPEHLRTHTRLLVRAKEWEAAGRARSSLLRGQDLSQAEAWLSEAEGKQPAPTQLHTAYVLASRKAASRRQRTVVGAVAIALVVSLVLSTIAIIQRGEAQDAQGRAEEQQVIAEERAAESRSRELGALSLLQVSQDPELALLLAIEAGRVAETDTATTALRSAIAASHVDTAIQEEAGVVSLALSVAGSTLAVGGNVRARGGDLEAGWLTLRPVDDLAQARPVVDFGAEAAEVADVAIDPRGRLVAVSTGVGKVSIVDVAEAAVVRDVFFPMVLGYAELAFSPEGDRLLVAGEAGVSWVDVGTWRVGNALSVPRSGSRWTDVAIDPTGRWAALSDGSGTYLIALARGSRPSRLSNWTARSLSFDASGSRLVAAVQDAALMWDVETGRQVQRFEAEGVTAVALSPDGAALLTGGADGQAAFWNVATGSQTASLIGHEQAVLGAAFDPSGTLAYTAGRDGYTRAWRVPSETLPITTDPVLALSGDGSLIVTGREETVTFRHGRSGGALFSVTPRDRVAFAPSGCVDPSVGAPPKVRLSHDGTLAVEVYGEGCLLAIDVVTGEPLWFRDLSAPTDSAIDAEPEVWVSRDGEEVLVALFAAAGARVAEMRLLDAGTGDAVLREVTGTGPVYGADFSADGRLMFVTGRYGLLGAALYDLQEGTVLCPAQASDRVNDVTAIPSGGFALATVGGVQLVDDGCNTVDGGELTERRAPALEIAYRADGAVAATVDNDDTIRFWDVATGSQLGSARGSEDQLAFAEGGDVLVGGVDGARRYACDVCGTFEELLALARSRVTRELTPEERATYLGEAA